MTEQNNVRILSTKPWASINSEFSSKAFELLSKDGKDVPIRLNSTGIPANLVKIRQDIETPVGIIVLRLQTVMALCEIVRLAVVKTGVPTKLFERSDKLSVASFQYAHLSHLPPNVLLHDSGIEWGGSLLAVVPNQDFYEAIILDLNTGSELTIKEVAQALGYLGLIGTYPQHSRKQRTVC